MKIEAAQRLQASNVAQNILQQLGGSKFIAMTGAKNFVNSGDGLYFSIGKGAINKANKVEIKLHGNDTYEMKFYNLRGTNLKDLGSIDGLHAADLRRAFTIQTGLQTSI